MNIALASAFRNSASSGHLGPYFAQAQALLSYANDTEPSTLSLVAMVGDSRDDTDAQIRRRCNQYGIGLSLVDCAHGGPVYHSTEDPRRMLALTEILRRGMRRIAECLDPSRIVLWVESDLRWDPHTVGTLLDYASRHQSGFDVFAPMIFAGDNFYDVWGFRGIDGGRFAPFAPHHNSLRNWDGELVQVNSVGSCLAFRQGLAQIRPIGDLALVSWCEGVTSAGYKIGVDPSLKVFHP